MRKNIITIVRFLIFLSCATQVYAQDYIQLKNQAFKEKPIVKADGSKGYELIEPGSAIPGDEIIYITTFTNIGKEDVTDIVITNPVPNNSLYKKGSAFGSGTEITFSIDDGKTYADAKQLKVKGKDGQETTALPEDYTTIKWTFKNTLKPGQESTVTFRTILQ